MAGTGRWVVARMNDLALILWVCRVSFFSAFLGFALLVLVPQARDLFIDVPAGWGWRGYFAIFGHASAVAISVLFFWALPVFFVARSAVDDQRWISPYARSVKYSAVGMNLLHKRFSPLVEAVPLLLGLSCFFSVEIGLVLVYSDLYDPTTVTAANDAKFQLHAHLFATNVSAGIFFVVANWRTQIHDATLGRWTAPLTAWQPVSRPSRRQAGQNKALDRIRTVSFAALTLFVLFIFVAPQARFGLERATLLPVVLGAWVPVLGWLARKSYVVRLPLVVVAVLAIFVLPALVGGQHDVRLLPSPKTQSPQSGPVPGQQWYLHDALIEWAKHNDCELPPPTSPTCPRLGSAPPEKPKAVPNLVRRQSLSPQLAVLAAQHLSPLARSVPCLMRLAPNCPRRTTRMRGASNIRQAPVCNFGRFWRVAVWRSCFLRCFCGGGRNSGRPNLAGASRRHATLTILALVGYGSVQRLLARGATAWKQWYLATSCPRPRWGLRSETPSRSCVGSSATTPTAQDFLSSRGALGSTLSSLTRAAPTSRGHSHPSGRVKMIGARFSFSTGHRRSRAGAF